MVAKLHIAFFSLLVGLFLSAALAASPQTVLLDVEDGETSFMVDQQNKQAWWIVGECRRSIPMQTKNTTNTMLSEVISNDVRIGSHPVKLRQQFRFTLSGPSTSLEVYNSVRGGWANIPVHVNETCTLDASCRSRMEKPVC